MKRPIGYIYAADTDREIVYAPEDITVAYTAPEEATVIDHLQGAKDGVTAAVDQLNRTYGIRAQDAAYLIMAVRHHVAEELRHVVDTNETLSEPTMLALGSEACTIDPFRLDPVTMKWVIK